MSGRFHYYEGYDFEELAAPIRVFKLLGVRATILTNAAGAVNTAYNVGDIMVVKDHIKIIGASPVRGPNIPELGPRFFDVSQMYTPSLRALALSCAKSSARNTGCTRVSISILEDLSSRRPRRSGRYGYWEATRSACPR